MDKSNGSAVSDKPASKSKPQKPRDDFPLYAHATKRWAKKVRGKVYYFGPWSDPQGALDEWLRQRDYLLEGKTPPQKLAEGQSAGATVKFVIDAFLTAKERKRDAGEITPRTFDELYATGVMVANAFGRDRLVSDLASADFSGLRAQLAKRLGKYRLANEIQRVRSIFKYAFEEALIGTPVRFGTEFKKPDAKAIRLERMKRGRRDLPADQIRMLIDKARIPLKAMILLGVNCGFGNADCATLPIECLDLDGGWHDYGRPKTGIQRRAKLWPETVEALRTAIAERPKPNDSKDEDLVFVTKYGSSWSKGEAGNEPVGAEFRKLAEDSGITLKDGVSFYGLRRTFETVAGDSADQVAVDHVMGHVPASNDMGAVYRQKINDARLEALANHVRAWLFPQAGRTPKPR